MVEKYNALKKILFDFHSLKTNETMHIHVSDANTSFALYAFYNCYNDKIHVLENHHGLKILKF